MKWFASILIVMTTLVSGQLASAKTLWKGDFETGDLTQWPYLVNKQGLSVSHQCVFEGESAGLVSLSGSEDFLWNGRDELNRSEYHYKPPAESIREGKNTYFGWSFLLPEALVGQRHEIGYWESTSSYQQMFRMSLEGSQLNFEETSSGRVILTEKDFAVPGRWQDIALHIHWSVVPAKGFVQVWLNGKNKGRYSLQTLYKSDEAMFVQVGLLRKRIDATELMFIDNARHVSHRADLLASVGKLEVMPQCTANANQALLP